MTNRLTRSLTPALIAIASPEPPGYRRGVPPKRPKLDPFTTIIDRIL